MPFMWVMILKLEVFCTRQDIARMAFNALYVGDDFET